MKYSHKSRIQISSNQRFNVYFDHLEIENSLSIKDFLIVSPKDRIDDHVVGVAVLPIIANKIGLMRVWRHQLNKFMWQSPAGFVEQGTNAEENAQRELKEETGFRAMKLIDLGRFCTDSGLVDGFINLFIANELIRVKEKVDLEIGASDMYWFKSLELQALLKNSSGDFGMSTYLACKFALEMHYE